MIAATQQEQRAFNIGLRDWIRRHARTLVALVAVAALVFVLGPRIERHRGIFSASFNQDFDVDYAALVLRGGFEFGGGSLNLVNTRWAYGKVLIGSHW